MLPFTVTCSAAKRCPVADSTPARTETCLRAAATCNSPLALNGLTKLCLNAPLGPEWMLQFIACGPKCYCHDAAALLHHVAPKG